LLLLQALGDELRAKFAATKAQVLAIVRQQELLEDPSNGASPELDEKLRLRAPYVAPLNVLQVRGGGLVNTVIAATCCHHHQPS
jgi:phosphoenolpyruvate carboxylase